MFDSFVLYVNGEDKVTDVSVNDGKWHHIAVTWQSEGGAWKIFTDGDLSDQGSGLAAGSIINGRASSISLTCMPLLWDLAPGVWCWCSEK